MTDDSPERELDADDSNEIYSRAVQTDREGHSNVAGDVSSSTEVRTSHKAPRREVRWKLDKSANNRSLESVVRRFEDYLDCVSAFSADSPLRRFTASPHKLVSHRCPGYLREEITLTADVSRSVVVAHQYPSQSEICTICGQLVRYPSNPVPLVADDPFIHLTPSPEEPTAVHGFESSGLFNPLSKYDADWNIPTPETQTIWSIATPETRTVWSIATPEAQTVQSIATLETQTVNLQMWGSVPLPDAQHGRSPVVKSARQSTPRTTVTRVNNAERRQQEMATERHWHVSPGMPGPFELTEDKRSRIQDWASWIREF